MSNTYKALIAIITIIILGSGIFILSKSRPSENLSVSVSSSSSQQTVSSIFKTASSVQAVSSSIQPASKIVEVSTVSKAVEVKSQVVKNSTCNLPESENLVKTEDGCFEYTIWDNESIRILPKKTKDFRTY